MKKQPSNNDYVLVTPPDASHGSPANPGITLLSQVVARTSGRNDLKTKVSLLAAVREAAD